MRTRWLDDDEQQVWRAYLRMNTLVGSHLRRHLMAAAGLSDGDYEVLVNLSEARAGRLRAFELADAMQWEQSRLSHHLTRMRKRGLIEREDCGSDGRGSFIVITKDGRAEIRRAAPKHVAEVRRVFIDVLTNDQRQSLLEIATSVVAALERAHGRVAADHLE